MGLVLGVLPGISFTDNCYPLSSNCPFVLNTFKTLAQNKDYSVSVASVTYSLFSFTTELKWLILKPQSSLVLRPCLLKGLGSGDSLGFAESAAL